MHSTLLSLKCKLFFFCRWVLLGAIAIVFSRLLNISFSHVTWFYSKTYHIKVWLMLLCYTKKLDLFFYWTTVADQSNMIDTNQKFHDRWTNILLLANMVLIIICWHGHNRKWIFLFFIFIICFKPDSAHLFIHRTYFWLNKTGKWFIVITKETDT